MKYLNYCGYDVTVTHFGNVKFPSVGEVKASIRHLTSGVQFADGDTDTELGNPNQVLEFRVTGTVYSLPEVYNVTYIVTPEVFIACPRRDFVTPFRLKDGRCEGFVRHP